jgi:hypothetical protein
MATKGARQSLASSDELEAQMDWRLYADRSRFTRVPLERMLVLQGSIRRPEGKVWGKNWHVFMETADFDRRGGRSLDGESS